jgi:hypothetical protein
LKTCRCRATSFEKRIYRAAMASSKSHRAALVYKNKLPRRIFQKPAVATMFFKNVFRISLLRLYWTENIGASSSDSFSLRVFHL